MITDAAPDAVARLANEVAVLTAQEGREAALRHALAGSGLLLRSPSRSLRFDLRRKVFSKVKRIGYQLNDFECIDYEQFEVADDLTMFRGPVVPTAALESGNYFCVVGAAQTFGRLVRRPWPILLSEAIGLPVLNLSRGGCGPEFFTDPRLIALIGGARFVVLQVMSGRSVGCSDYPGGRRITRGSETTNVQRLDVLESLWRNDRRVALDYVRRWNSNYLELYRRLRSLIHVPTALLWVSERDPGDWKPECLLEELDWGRFPQLVGSELYESVAALFKARMEYVFKPSTEQPTSRVTGRPCPFFWTDKNLHNKFSYYPTSKDNLGIAEALIPWAVAAGEGRAG